MPTFRPASTGLDHALVTFILKFCSKVSLIYNHVDYWSHERYISYCWERFSKTTTQTTKKFTHFLIHTFVSVKRRITPIWNIRIVQAQKSSYIYRLFDMSHRFTSEENISLDVMVKFSHSSIPTFAMSLKTQKGWLETYVNFSLGLVSFDELVPGFFHKPILIG